MRLVLHYGEAELKALITVAVTAQRNIAVQNVRLNVIEARDMHDMVIGTHVVSCEIECEEKAPPVPSSEESLFLELSAAQRAEGLRLCSEIRQTLGLPRSF